jgi:hypothetical protein
LIPKLDEGRTPPDCDTFEFSPRGWRSADEDVHRTNAYGVAQCHLLQRRTMAEVGAMLGRPATSGMIGQRTYWSYSGLDVVFHTGRAVETQAGAS